MHTYELRRAQNVHVEHGIRGVFLVSLYSCQVASYVFYLHIHVHAKFLSF